MSNDLTLCCSRFRWVACQLEELRTCFTLAALMNVLKSLPKTLDEVYDRLLLRIPEGNREIAHRALQWLAYAKRPLLLKEVAAAVVVETGVSALSPEHSFFEPQDILNVCSSLVSYSDHIGLLGLAHYSVQEYLVSRRIREGRAAFYQILEVPAHILLAETCLTYLLSFNESGPGDGQKYHLLPYAADNWYKHLCAVPPTTDSESLTTQACELLDHRVTQAFRHWVKVHRADEHGAGDQQQLRMFTFWTPPLAYACHWGMLEVVRLLLEKGADVNRKDPIYKRTALMVAAAAGHSKIVHLLLQNGANIDLTTANGDTALCEAIKSGQRPMVQFLLKNTKANSKTSLDFLNSSGCTLLQGAAMDGDLAFMKVLLDNGADVNARSRSTKRCALHYAAIARQPAAIQLILDRGVENKTEGPLRQQALHAVCQLPAQRVIVETPCQKIGRDCTSGASDELVLWPSPENKADIDAKVKDGEAALHLASATGMKLPVQLLLSAGASINAQNKFGETALSKAARSSDDDLMQLLLRNGALAELRDQFDQFDQTALHIATRDSRISSIQQLLNAGANIDALDADHETPLLEATSAGHEKVVQLLLENGANAKVKDTLGRTALHMALTAPDAEHIVQLLLDAGIDTESHDSGHETPLLTAIRCNNEKGVQLLLKNGADILAKDKTSQTAMHILPSDCDQSLAQRLLEAGADIHARDDHGQTPLFKTVLSRKGRTALHGACAFGKAKKVELLLEAGADIEARDYRDSTPLMSAVKEENGEVIQLLLKWNASMEARDRAGSTALHYACCLAAADELVELLLKAGADIDARDSHGQTPLFRAVESKAEKTVPLLLKTGANVQARDLDGERALHIATSEAESDRWRSVAMPHILLDAGADADATNEKGLKPSLNIIKVCCGTDLSVCLRDRPEIARLPGWGAGGSLERTTFGRRDANSKVEPESLMMWDPMRMWGPTVSDFDFADLPLEEMRGEEEKALRVKRILGPTSILKTCSALSKIQESNKIRGLEEIRTINERGS